MNKIRLIKIYELRGLIHPIEQYVIGFLDGVGKVQYPSHIQYRKDHTGYFRYYFNINVVYISNYIYDDFNTNFRCSFEEIREIMKYLLEKHLKIEIKEVN